MISVRFTPEFARLIDTPWNRRHGTRQLSKHCWPGDRVHWDTNRGRHIGTLLSWAGQEALVQTGKAAELHGITVAPLTVVSDNYELPPAVLKPYHSPLLGFRF
jgi:hypothetical protein